MTDPQNYRIFIPSDPEVQRHVLTTYMYHDSLTGMHRGRDATYNTLSQDFYWCNMHKHVKNCVRRCPQCIRFKTIPPARGPIQLHLYQHPFHTLGIDFVGELPHSPSDNKWIRTAVCPYSNYRRAIPVPDKTATTAAYALVNDVFLSTGFPSVLQSDRGGEWLNALLHRITKLLSVKHAFTSGFQPRLNGATERTHCFLNTALGIFCEKQQEKWEQFLQPAVYAHNVSPISSTSNVAPFFLVFGRHFTSPETISCNYQFIYYHQITMQNTLFQGYRLLIKNLLRSKQISAVDRKIFMIGKLVFCPSHMVKLFMFARNHHHIYQAVLHVLSGISMVHI